MKKIAGLLFMFLLVIIISCEKEENLDNRNEIIYNQKTGIIIESDNSLGFKLIKQIENEQGKNLCISPLSVSMALGMTYNGADGETKKAMEETLGLEDLSMEDINGSYRDLINALSTNDSKVLFEIANSIWSKQGFDIENDFITTNSEYFNARTQELDFNDPGAVDTINAWVSEKTHDKIETIIDEISPDVVMYLINAIYFKGIWKYEFEEDDTEDYTFTLENSEQISVPVMKQEGKFNYLTNDLFSSVELKYGSGNFSMHILLPNYDKNVDDIIESIDNEYWDQCLSQYEETEEVKVFLPRFKFEYEKSLNEELKALGMAIAFTTSANFTGIHKNGGIYISDVKHKTFIDVNEEGTEAAAVTSVEVSLTSDSGVYFMALKPFIFIIKE
ncbi:serpin family protein, partial [Bacteroidota bacterium]